MTDAVENRRLLDDAWNENARDFCLGQGNWNFATRTIETDYDSSVSDPGFGFSRAFTKPSDWIRTVQLASDEYFYSPLAEYQYVDEVSNWWADIDTIYVRYVSNDSAYGYDLSLWPQSFVNYFEWHLAEKIAPRVIQDTARVESIMKSTKRALIDALSKDALNEGAKFKPIGKWVSARRGGRGSRRDRGSRSSLTG